MLRTGRRRRKVTAARADGITDDGRTAISPPTNSGKHGNWKLKTNRITPTWKRIKVTEHAVRRYSERCAKVPMRESCIRALIMGTVMHGRRSDRQSVVLTEIARWVTVTRDSNGRPITFFVKGKTVCVVAADLVEVDTLVVLTCFRAVEKGKPWNPIA